MKFNEIEGIAFSNEWFSGQHRIEEAGHYPFAIYGLLHYIEPMCGGIATTIENILLWFNMETTKRRNLDKIKDALKYLYEQDIIVFYEDIKHTIPASIDIDTIKGRTPLYIGIKERPQGKYTLINFSEFEKLLLDEEHKGNAKVELMCYFSAIIFHINNETKRAFPSLNALKSEACVRRLDTCSKYNDFLMDELKMIRFQSSMRTNSETGRLYPTQYVRYEDEDVLNEEMERQREYSIERRIARLVDNNIDNRRVLSQRIMRMIDELNILGEDNIYIKHEEYSDIIAEIESLEITCSVNRI